MTGTLHEDQYTFLIISLSLSFFLLKLKMFQTEVKKIETHLVRLITIFSKNLFVF